MSTMIELNPEKYKSENILNKEEVPRLVEDLKRQ